MHDLFAIRESSITELYRQQKVIVFSQSPTLRPFFSTIVQLHNDDRGTVFATIPASSCKYLNKKSRVSR